MEPCAWVETLQFSDGTTVNLGRNDIVVIAGPNNSGKSACLRAVRDLLLKKDFHSPVISRLSLAKEGDASSLGSWLDSFAMRIKSDAQNPSFHAFDTGIQLRDAQRQWEQSSHFLGQLTRFFCHMLSADERLRVAKGIKNIALVREPPSHPIHYLLRDDRLETKISDQFRKAFGVDLVVHRSAGSEVPLLTGNRPTPADGQDRVSYEYVKKLESLDHLNEQGDGMRSFAGVLLFTSVGKESIILIDEPEAFLHPPQARLLGRMLVSDKQSGRQLFIATHSGDVLKGILDANNPNVRVVRICDSPGLSDTGGAEVYAAVAGA